MDRNKLCIGYPGARLLNEATSCFASLADHESLAASKGAAAMHGVDKGSMPMCIQQHQDSLPFLVIHHGKELPDVKAPDIFNPFGLELLLQTS